MLVVPGHDFAFVAFGNSGAAAMLHDRYRSNQLRVDVKPVDGQLEEAITLEPFDDVAARSFSRFGGLSSMPSRRLVAVGDGLFAPAGVPLATFNGLIGRRMLVSFHGRSNGPMAARTAGLSTACRAGRWPDADRAIRDRLRAARGHMTSAIGWSGAARARWRPRGRP